MTDDFFQAPFPVAPALVPMTRIACDVEPLVSLGDAPTGERRYVPLSGGIVQGPEINGRIRAVGVDWQVARRDGVLEIAAHYVIETRPLVVSCGTQQSESMVVVEPGGHVGRSLAGLSTCPRGGSSWGLS